MCFLENVSENIWKIKADSNVYFIKEKESYVIATGRREHRNIVKDGLERLSNLGKIKKVIFTHLHYDHVGNFDLFSDSEFYASKKEIESFEKDALGAVLDPEIVEIFRIRLNPLETLDGFDIIASPGHTSGSICLYYREKKVLFSGDTLFFRGAYGRTDLPTSAPGDMESSLKTLRKLDYTILCPGHEY